MSSLTNSVDSDEMPPNEASPHQSTGCLDIKTLGTEYHAI